MPTADPPPVLHTFGLDCAVGAGRGRRVILRDVALTVAAGEVVGLIGPNGGGKTTLLRTLSGALPPARGQVLLHGRPLHRLTARQTAREVALVAQEPSGELALSVAETVLLGRTPHLGMLQRQSRHDEEIAERALREVGVHHLALQEVSSLSGGERQRVMIARALAQEATCLLLDEPTNHLDIGFQHQVLQLLRGLRITTVVVLHDLNLAARYCDRLLLLHDGGVRASGRPDDVLAPDLLDEVYGVGADPVAASDGTAQLLFRREARPPSTPKEHRP
ncbi:ABC transporter ATP-binding protein [Nesterenkonia sp. PF2B19]|uniref:ABC transporter ATP-binding protein n=1 Tax=Nesterenkonia sp. PF2B19 TaxID=1881858 RepID=UPI0009F4BCD3|nr:ABC transporter ATP-binding protein [Nesterenkonia sp. PF2B19]OSM42185.1 histidinol phosphatase [Nesterenkonia sp. PF2B19]